LRQWRENVLVMSGGADGGHPRRLLCLADTGPLTFPSFMVQRFLAAMVEIDLAC
jgi:hypothetical protein